MKNIFIEGMQGTGKTTLLEALSQKLEGYRIYREGDISPVELAWCGYLTKAQYDLVFLRFPELGSAIRAHTEEEEDHLIVAYTRIRTENAAFYQYMEQFEIYNGRRSFEEFRNIIFHHYNVFRGEGNLFECSFFQNIIDDMLLFYQLEEDAIVVFYRELLAQMEREKFCLVYLDSENFGENLEQIRKERVDETGREVWYEVMLHYLRESPYGKSCRNLDETCLTAYFDRRRRVEKRIISEVLDGYCIMVEAKKYDLEELVKTLRCFKRQ